MRLSTVSLAMALCLAGSSVAWGQSAAVDNLENRLDMMKQLGEGISVGPGGSQKLSPEKIQEMIKQMQKQAPAQGAPPPAEGAPPAEAQTEPAAPLGPLAPIPDAPAPASSGGQ